MHTVLVEQLSLVPKLVVMVTVWVVKLTLWMLVCMVGGAVPV